MTNKLYGAILGDLAGQPYEFPAMKHFPKEKEINLHNPDSHITDDTLMTLASAAYILGMSKSIEAAYKDMGHRYSGDYYGKSFKEWLNSSCGTVGTSYGNGCLMRISPFMWAKSDLATILDSVRCSHHNEISYLAVINLWKLYHDMDIDYDEDIPKPKRFKTFGVRADITFDFCKKVYVYHALSTKKSIITAIKCGGDTDTNASIVGELSNFYYPDLTKQDVEYVESKLDAYQLQILHNFNKKFI